MFQAIWLAQFFRNVPVQSFNRIATVPLRFSKAHGTQSRPSKNAKSKFSWPPKILKFSFIPDLLKIFLKFFAANRANHIKRRRNGKNQSGYDRIWTKRNEWKIKSANGDRSWLHLRRKMFASQSSKTLKNFLRFFAFITINMLLILFKTLPVF